MIFQGGGGGADPLSHHLDPQMRALAQNWVGCKMMSVNCKLVIVMALIKLGLVDSLYLYADKAGIILLYTTYNSVDLAAYEKVRSKVGEGGLRIHVYPKSINNLITHPFKVLESNTHTCYQSSR